MWQTLDRTALERVLGTEADLDYPPGTYTAAVVTALVQGRRPAVIDFDPARLAPLLRQITRLHAYRSALLAAAYTRTSLPALALLAGSGHHEAARAAEALGIAVRVLVPDALVAIEDYGLLNATADPGAHLVQRRFPRPSAAEQHLLDSYAQMPDSGLSAGAVHRALTVVRTLADKLLDQAATGGPHADADLADAAAAAVPQLVSARHLLDPALIDDPGPTLQVITEPGAAEQAYLATVSWWGPADGDAHRAEALRGHLWEKDLDGLRTGYDPFNRLVLHSTSTGALERPRALPATPYPDGATLLATPSAMSCFVQLPDGRCDILPTDPRYTYDDVTGG